MKGTIVKTGIVKEGSFYNAVGDNYYGSFSNIPKVGERFVFWLTTGPWHTSIVKKVEKESENVLTITTMYSVYELTIESDD